MFLKATVIIASSVETMTIYIFILFKYDKTEITIKPQNVVTIVPEPEYQIIN